MATTETYIANASALFRYSGQYTTTIRSSLSVAALTTNIADITWNGTDSFFSGTSVTALKKIYKQSGNFSSTLKDSVTITITSAQGLDVDKNFNTPWSSHTPSGKLYLQSGQLTSTLKTSISVNSIDTQPTCITFDGTDSFVIGSNGPGEKYYRFSGQYTTTIKDSLVATGIDAAIWQGSYDGVNVQPGGGVKSKAILTSGYFTTTIKTSQVYANIKGVDTDDYLARQGVDTSKFPPPGGGGRPTRSGRIMTARRESRLIKELEKLKKEQEELERQAEIRRKLEAQLPSKIASALASKFRPDPSMLAQMSEDQRFKMEVMQEINEATRQRELLAALKSINERMLDGRLTEKRALMELIALLLVRSF